MGVLKNPNKSSSIYMRLLALANFISFHPHHVSSVPSTFYQTPINHKMKFQTLSFILMSLGSLFNHSSAVPQGVYETITPHGAPPADCATTYGTLFGVVAYEGLPRTAKMTRTCIAPGSLAMRLVNGVLIDSLGRIGCIVANRQFQFDGPPAQAGAIYTGGWSVCADGVLALGSSKKFYQCSSGNCGYLLYAFSPLY